jgi:hypothetical protein
VNEVLEAIKQALSNDNKERFDDLEMVRDDLDPTVILFTYGEEGYVLKLEAL